MAAMARKTSALESTKKNVFGDVKKWPQTEDHEGVVLSATRSNCYNYMHFCVLLLQFVQFVHGSARLNIAEILS